MGTNILYSKYRKLSREGAKARLLWELNGGAGALVEFILNLCKLVILLAIVVALLAWAEELSAKEDHAFSQAHRIQQLELALLSCLNYKGVYLDGELHLCGFANTWIKAE